MDEAITEVQKRPIMFQRLPNSWKNHLGFVYPLLIPSVMSAYALVSMNSRTRFTGYLDHVLFSLVFGLGYGLIFAAPQFLWRFVLSFSYVFAAALCYLFVNLNSRFFNSWGQMDALKQWEDVFAVWSGIMTLMKPGDLVFGLLLPLVLWQASLSHSGSYFRKSKRAMGLIGIALFLGHYKLTEGRNSYADQNPIFYVFRQKAFQLQMKYGGGSGLKGPRLFKASDFVQNNPSLHKVFKNPDHPFVKIPIENPVPLPFAVTTKPNVVLILMESVRAFESGSYGASPSLTPNLDRLAKEGILFKKFYATGAQTIRGEFAIHSSYVPNMRGGQVYIDQPNLGVKTLGMVFKEHGYSTHWIGSHPPTFDNKIKFHSQHGIDSFHYKFESRRPSIGMGAADMDLMENALSVLLKQKEPYFAEIMTLSNHYPFAEYPTDTESPPVSGSDIYKRYCRGMFYTDSAIGYFFEKVRKLRAFDNTIFVLTGDHGVWIFPDDQRFAGMVMRQEVFFRSPLVFWSPLLKPQVISLLGSHIDVMPTLLDLLNIRLPNAFLGTSLFRDDTVSRYALMTQDTRWNLRWGNDYAFDTGPEAFLSHYPLGTTLDFEKILKGDPIDHLYFSTEKDLFQNLTKDETRLLDENRRGRMEAFAQEAIYTFDQTLLNDKIYPESMRGERRDSHE